MSTETRKAPAVVVVGHHKINADGSREGTIISSYRWPEIVEDAGLTGQWMELVLVPAAPGEREWSLLEATQESLREHSQMLRERDARIAELEADLSRAYDAFGIGEEARQPVVLMTNIENARRRSNCLSRIESILSAEEVCEDGDIDSVSLLRWGDEPDVYEVRFRKVLEAQVRTAGVEALEKMGERFRKMLKEGGSSTACRYCFRRAAEECEEEARRLRGEGE